MTSSIPYDPDDFDNNPFAEQSASGILSQENQDQYGDRGVSDDNVVAASGPAIGTIGAYGTVGSSIISTQPPRQPFGEEEPLNKQQQQQQQQQQQHHENNDSPLNRFPTDADLKKYIPERYNKSKFSLTIKVAEIEKNGNVSNAFKNPIFKLNATVKGLNGFRKAIYKDVRRSYKELDLFNKFLKINNLEVFVPALPIVPTLYNFGSDEFKITLGSAIQSWFDRITSNPILVNNSEFVLFLENNDFHYSPSKTKPSNIVMATGLRRKTLKQLQPPYDECQDLAEFRPLMKAVYVNSQLIKTDLENIDRLDKKLCQLKAEYSSKLQDLQSVEISEDMSRMWVKLSKTSSIVNELDLIKSHTVNSMLLDTFNLLIDDSYIIKESLTNRHLLMRELINAEEVTRKRHATIAKLKNKAIIDPLKVDEAIRALEAATIIENKLNKQLVRTTYNMLLEKKEYLEFLDKKVKEVFKKLTIKTIENERKKLSLLESLRNDLRNVSSIKGGLARLGRENYPDGKIAKRTKSQSFKGDDWSGRTKRVIDDDKISNIENVEDIIDELTAANNITNNNNNNNNNEADGSARLEDEEEVNSVDAKSAAHVLGQSTF
ncbi:hypothetical protein PACTADRAFT_48716 [Pachysolen tannophilus NRRL Y-2460]|uniref:Vacuolar protein sorting-associated protein 17 n=1 Tax=Pachysolen tannophilus NRRL Y-2460 TaxID=669874 RepID=A0A1E4TZ26_PACTA|nr:hypothetical protein PACTADRAFT_48716 [Pachysolen tannophilus NRRL Y-2460]